MKIISFTIWNSPVRSSVESLFQQLPFVSRPESLEMDDWESIKKNVTSTRRIVAELRRLMEAHEFQSESEEIIFFKRIKPLFSGSLKYWEQLLELYLHRPVGEAKGLQKYYKKRLKTLKAFYERHTGFYEYLRGNDEHLDNMYFLRSGRPFEESAISMDLNPKFSTLKDGLVGDIYANDQLEHYLHRLLSLPLKIPLRGTEGPANLKWTGSRAGLVELIYALQSGGVYNNGQIGIKELADSFQHLFQVDLGNYYHVFNELRLRKKNRTVLLDHLRERVIRKMDTMDEK